MIIENNNETNLEKFNTGVGFYYRIDTLLSAASMHQFNNDIRKWHSTLMALFKDVYAKAYANEKDRTEMKRELNKVIDELISKGGVVENMNDNVLFEFDIYLRTYLDKKGMLTPKADDPNFALGK